MRLLHLCLACVLGSTSLWHRNSKIEHLMLFQMTEEELVRCLRQLGSTKSSKYVGVNKNKNSGKWEARYPLSKKEHGGGSKYV